MTTDVRTREGDERWCDEKMSKMINLHVHFDTWDEKGEQLYIDHIPLLIKAENSLF